MVRGLLADIHFPYATFPASSLKGCDLFPLLWDAVERLTRLDFRVLVGTCDGASCNRKMFSMHGKKDEFVHKTINVFSKDKDYIYFICDPPHLIKTIRNCLASSKRHLWVSDVLRLYGTCMYSTQNISVLWKRYQMELYYQAI